MSKLIGGQISEDALTSIFTGKIDARCYSKKC